VRGAPAPRLPRAAQGKADGVRVLVLTSEPISADLLRSVTGDLPSDAEVLVVAPATTGSKLRFWVSDVDDAIAKAEVAQVESVERLEEGGIDAAGEVGESDPLLAVEDALRTFPADRVVVFTHARGERDYREDGELPAEIRERFGVPVDVGTITR
jgi:hypothetical protein